MHKIIYPKYKVFVCLCVLASACGMCIANDMQDAIAALSQSGSMHDITKEGGDKITRQAFDLKPENSGDLDAQLAQIEANYKAQIDATTLTQNHDPLKSGLSNHKAGSASFAKDLKMLTDKSSSERKKIKIAKNDELLMAAQNIDKKTVIDASGMISIPTIEPEFSTLEDRIVTCREAGDEVAKKCYRTRIVKAVQPEDIKFNVELEFTANSYSGHHTSFDLKSGIVSFQNSNYGSSKVVNSFDKKAPNAQIISIRNIRSDRKGHTRDVYYSTNEPTAANDYIYKCDIRQDNVGSKVKKKHKQNRNQDRGRIEKWEVVARPAPVLEEYWDNGECATLGNYAQQNFCEGPVINLLEANVAKSITGYPTPVMRSYWQEEHIYSCGGGSIANECGSLLDAGCTQVDSKCIETRGPFCVEYLQTFNCGKKNISSNLRCEAAKIGLSSESNIGVNDGFDAQDFGNAVAQLSMVEELKKNIVRGDGENILLFKGDRLTCDKDWGSDIKNCCNLKGIFKNIIGHRCPKEVEEILAPAVVRQKRCVEVAGWQCIAKTMGKCRKWRKSFCCYQGRLARIFQQIAHHQLGISWGSAESPNCGPLDPRTFSKLNFDEPFARNLLKELVDEATVNAQKYADNANAKLANSADLNEKVKALQDRIGTYYENKTNGW